MIAEDSDDAIYTINDCFALNIDTLQPSLDLCEDAKGRVDFVIRNNGQRQDTYTVSVSNIPDSLDVSFIGGSMSLAPGASRTVLPATVNCPRCPSA